MVVEERALATDVIDAASYRVLDQYVAGIADESPRIEAIATISAGAKNEKGLPSRSSDGTIFLHDPNGRAPALAEALESTGRKRLTIALPFNDPRQFIQQRFAAYSASALRAYGDEESITVLEGGRKVYRAAVKAERAQYEEWAKACKVQASIFFCLSEWDEDGAPVVSMPDGLGYYRLRTTSRNSIRSILSTIRYAAEFTRGRIAGLPFTLSIEQRDVAMADGKRQRVPVWVAVIQPPGGVHLTSRTFAAMARQALTEGANLYLLAPPASETVDTAIIEAEAPYVVDEDDLPMSDTGRCNPADYCAKWFAITKGTPLGEQESPARAAFIARYCQERGLPLTTSLGALLKTFTDLQALDLIDAVERHLRDERESDEAAVMHPETGELPMTEEEAAAAAIAAEQLAAAPTLAEQLFDDAPEPDAPVLDPGLVAAAEKMRAWFRKGLPWKRAAYVAKDAANFQGARLAEVTGSIASAGAVLRYLTGKPDDTFARLSPAEATRLDELFTVPGASEKIAASVPVAKAWAAGQAPS